MTPEQIKDEILKIKDTEVIKSLGLHCELVRTLLTYSKELQKEYDITLTRKVVKEEDLPAVDNPTFREEWAVVFKGFAFGKKLPAIKLIREATGLGLKEAKEISENKGTHLFISVTREESYSFNNKWFGGSTVILTEVTKI
jgi:ribosomal protein L7/L12